MNERIKELIWLAKIMAEETINKKISKNAELDAFSENFAELIIKECFVKLSPYMDDQFSNDIESELREHFGFYDIESELKD